MIKARLKFDDSSEPLDDWLYVFPRYTGRFSSHSRITVEIDPKVWSLNARRDKLQVNDRVGLATLRGHREPFWW